MKHPAAALLFLLAFVTSYSQHTRQLALTEQKNFVAMREYEQRSIASGNFDVDYYRCEWKVDPTTPFISGSVTSYFTILTNTNTIVFDFSNVLNIDSIIFRGNTISFTQSIDNGLHISFPITLNAGERDSVRIHYQGYPPSSSAFTTASHSGVPILWTLSEPYGARTWWPCKDGLTDKADSIDIILTHPVAYVSSSNGLPISETVNGGERTTVWKHRYPIASYLVAIAVTNYNISSTTANLPGGPMPLVAYAYPEAAGSFAQATTTAKFCLEEFSLLFGEYPFSNERYAQTQWSVGGGMEHQTNSFIVTGAPDLVAHELGHQWFGDKITCRSWSDIWLNEGFATYSEFLHTELSDPSNKLNTLVIWRNNITSQPGGSVYVLDTLNEARLFSPRLTYLKGGYLVHMLRWILGDSTFFRGVRRYLNDPLLSYGTALSSDLKRNLEAESGVDLTNFFDDWLYGEGYPNYSAIWIQKPNFEVEVKLDQTQSHPSVSFFEMPVPLYFSSATKDTIIRVDHVQNGQIFTVNPGFAADTMMIDPELWILSKTKTTQKTTSSLGPLKITIAPNPVSDVLHVKMSAPIPTHMYADIFNALGQKVYSTPIQPGATQVDIPVHAYASGYYWIMIGEQKGNIRLKQQFLISGN